MREFDLAWLAGVIDGEGTIRLYRCIDKRKRNGFLAIKPDVRLTNADPNIITPAVDILRELVGETGTVGLHWSKNKKSTMPCCHIQVTSRQAIVRVLGAIIPHLRGKKAQAEIVVRYCEQRIAKQPHRGGRTIRQDSYDEALIDELRTSLVRTNSLT